MLPPRLPAQRPPTSSPVEERRPAKRPATSFPSAQTARPPAASSLPRPTVQSKAPLPVRTFTKAVPSTGTTFAQAVAGQPRQPAFGQTFLPTKNPSPVAREYPPKKTVFIDEDEEDEELGQASLRVQRGDAARPVVIEDDEDRRPTLLDLADGIYEEDEEDSSEQAISGQVKAGTRGGRGGRGGRGRGSRGARGGKPAVLPRGGGRGRGRPAGRATASNRGGSRGSELEDDEAALDGEGGDAEEVDEPAHARGARFRTMTEEEVKGFADVLGGRAILTGISASDRTALLTGRSIGVSLDRLALERQDLTTRSHTFIAKAASVQATIIQLEDSMADKPQTPERRQRQQQLKALGETISNLVLKTREDNGETDRSA